ncbi:hypothetical protein ACFQ0M_46415 [Kitasatospora aburaviensis]
MSAIPVEIDTPDIMVELDVLERNIERMAAALRAKGLRLRPTPRPTRCRRSPRGSSPRGPSG